MRSSIIAIALLLATHSADAQRVAPVAAQPHRPLAVQSDPTPSAAAAVAPGTGGRVLKYALRGALLGAGIAGILSLVTSAQGDDCVAGTTCDSKTSAAANIGLGAGIGAVVGAVAGLSSRR